MRVLSDCAGWACLAPGRLFQALLIALMATVVVAVFGLLIGMGVEALNSRSGGESSDLGGGAPDPDDPFETVLKKKR